MSDRNQPADSATEDALSVVRRYHEHTKHRMDRYAAGPETMDWDAQPDPFRRFQGSTLIPLPLTADNIGTRYAQLYQPGAITPAPLTRESIGTLFELSLGLAAWKQFGTARWALRCNPSSGNLHPTEGYAVLPALDGIDAGVYHYASHEHALEQRCGLEDDTALTAALGPGRCLIGLSSIAWREAWKYGERAFRYCQLDTGHAIAALRYAAAILGWRLTLPDRWSDTQIAAALGLDRAADFAGVEHETAETILILDTNPRPAPIASPIATPTANPMDCPAEMLLETLAGGLWQGKANLLDPRPFYEWPVIDEVAAASRKPVTDIPFHQQVHPPNSPLPALSTADADDPAAVLIRRRRSTQAFDGQAGMSADALFSMLDRLLPRPGVTPWDSWGQPPRVHIALFVHNVDGLTPGLYALPRRPEALELMRSAMRDEFLWQDVPDCPTHLPLYQLVRANARKAARTVSCLQDIAGHACFSLAMLAEYDDTIEQAPWEYRRLYWEAGMIGQVLYLDAEAHGLRGTGIGCFFDDSVHEIFGLKGQPGDQRLQSLYHFAVGHPLTDTRLITLPPYQHLAR